MVREDLQHTMQRYVGIVRNGPDLKKGIEELERLKKDCSEVKADGASQYNPGWHEALSLRNLLIAAEAVAKAALMREESRGGHTREDFPNEKDEWLKYNIVTKRGMDGMMNIEKILRPDPDPELKRIAHATIEGLDAEVAKEKTK